MKRYIRSAAMLISAIFLTTGCNFKAANNEGAPRSDESPQVTVKVTKVMAGDLKLEPVLSMKVYGYETRQLNSKIDGYVQRFAVDIGDHFKQGDELAILYAPELGDEVIRREQLLIQASEDKKNAQANIRLVTARRDEQNVLLKLNMIKQQRLGNLVRSGSLNQEKLDEADAAVQATLAAIRSAEADIDATEAAYTSAVARRGVAAADLENPSHWLLTGRSSHRLTATSLSVTLIPAHWSAAAVLHC